MKPEDKYSNNTYNRPTYSPSFVSSPVAVSPGVDVRPIVSMPVVKPADNSLNQRYEGSTYDSSLETPNVGMTPTSSNNVTTMAPLYSTPNMPVERFSAFRFNRTASLITLAVVSFIVLIGIGSFMFNSFGSKSSVTPTTQSSGQPSTHYGISNLAIQGLSASSNLQVGVNQLSVNGQLQVNDTIILSPTAAPSSPVAGQIYYDQGSNQPYFYNGTRFVSLDPTHVNSLGGSIGDISLGQGLQIAGNQLSISSTLLQSMINSVPSGSTTTGVTNLTGTANQVSVSSATGNVILSLPQNINSTASPTFTGTTLGLAGTTSGSLIFANSSNAHTTTLQGLSSGTQNQLITIPASSATTDTVCLVSLGNCAGSGNGATTVGGVQNYITKYNNVGGTQLSNSLLFDNGVSVGVGNAAPNASYILDVSGNVHNTGNSVVDGSLNVLGGGGITVGVAGSVAGGVTFANNTSTQLGTLKMISPSGAGNVTFNIPSIVGGTTDTVCLMTLANCSGAGNSVTTTGGTINTLPKFSSSQGVTNSSITDDGTTVTINNVLSAATFTAGLIQSTGAMNITPGGNLTIGATNHVLALQGSGNTTLSATASGFTSTLGFTTPTANQTINLPNESGTICLQSSVNCGFAMAGSGVTTLNGLAGALTIANATGLGTTVTIQDASTAQKGIAQFNASDFTASAGVIDTIQAITTTSALQFASLGLGTTSTSGNLTLGATGTLVANTLSHTGTGHNISIDAGADNVSFSNSSGANTFLFPTTGGTGQVICTSGITCASGGGQAVILEPNGVQTSNSNLDSIFINRASGTGNLVKLQAGGLNAFVINSVGDTTISNTTTIAALQTNSITPTAALNIGSNAQTITLQGNLSSQFTATDPSTFTTSIGFSRKAPYTAPTGNVAYNFENDSNIAPGSYYVCTTVGNCAGVGGGITGSGTSGTVAIFTSSGNISDSLLTQASTTVTVGGNLAVGVANAGVTDYGLIFNNHTTANTVTLQLSAAPAASATILVPNVSGTVAVSAAGPLSLNATTGALTCPSCLTSGGGGGTSGVTSVDALTGVLTINNTTGSGSAVTIDNASTTVKGIAQFNSTNFSASSGVINTAQDIAVASSPTFANLTVQGATGLTIGSATNLGQAMFKDGTADGFTATFSPATLTASRLLTIPNASGTLAVSASGNLALSATGNLTISNSPNFTTSVTTPAILGSGTLTVDANGASALSLNSTGTGDILLGGGSGSTGCTVTNATGALACTSTINGATLSGGTLTATAVNTLNVSGTAISGTGTLTVDANGANNLSLGGIGTGDVLLGGGSGSTGCTITNSTGSLACTANLQGATLSATAANGLTLGTSSSLTGGIVFKGSGGAGTLTVVGPTTPNVGNFTLSIPAIGSNANICTDNVVCAGYSPGSGSGSYIQNQNASQQAASNFWLSGTGRADTSLLTPTLDTASAVALNIGSTASVINLNQSTLLTGNLSLASGANRTLNVLATPSGAGNSLTISAGASSDTSNGGDLNLQGGANGTGVGVGGNVNITSGNAGGNGNGNVSGSISITTPVAFNGASGNITLATSADRQTTGNVSITTGTSAITTAGSFSVLTGNSNANGTAGGAISLTVGSAVSSNPETGGAITLTAGAATSSANGGAISITTGAGGATTGNSGNLTLGTGATTGGSYGSTLFTQGGTTVASIVSGGATTFKNSANSTAAFQVQNSSAVSVLNVDTTNLRISVGSIGTATSQLYVAGLLPSATLGSVATGTNPYYFAVQGKYAYVVNNGSNTLRVVDISVPSSPAAVSSVATFTSPYSVVVSGKYAYVTNNGDATHGLQIFDISNPTSPVSVGTATTGTGPRTLAVQGRYVFVLNATANTIQSFDVSNPTLPVALTTQSTGSNPVGISVSGRYAYVTNNSGPSFTIFDISNPSSIPAGTTTSTTTAGPNPIYVQGRYAYLVASNSASAFQIWDISNPTTPTQTGSTTAGTSPNGLYVQGRYAYVIYNGGNFQIFDISNPAAPSSIGTYATGLTTPTGINVSGRYAYVTSSTGLVSFDLGGTYTQQLEAGGIETGTLQVNNAANFNNSVSIAAGLQVGQSLQVSGNIGSSGSVLFQNATNSTTAFQVQKATGTTVLDVDTTNGNVGIGTAAPATSLHIVKTSAGALTLPLKLENSSSSLNTAVGISFAPDATGTEMARISAIDTLAGFTTTDLVFSTYHGSLGGLGEKLRISAAGNVGIDTATIGTNNRLIVNAYSTVDNLATAQINTNATTNKGLVIQGIASQAANLLEVQNSAGTIMSSIGATGATLFQNTANSVAALQVQNSAGSAIFTADTSVGQAILGSASSVNGQLKVLNATNANAITIVTGATSASYSLTLPTAGPAVSQCLQSDATTASLLKFATCGSAHAKKIVLTAEYAGAVLDPGTGANNAGTMTSAIDLTNRENYYKWVTTQATSQSYDVDIQVPIPSDFSSWSGTPVSVDTYTTDTTNGTLQAEARDTAGGVEAGCNFVAITPSANNAWQTKTGCTIAGTYTAGGYMTLRLRMYATSAVTAVRVGNITLSYNSTY